MIYSFRQNNSGGYYIEPAQHIIVKYARDSKHAIEVALASGMYRNSGEDCSCCGDRWNGMEEEFGTVEAAIEEANQSFTDNHSGVRKWIVVDASKE